VGFTNLRGSTRNRPGYARKRSPQVERRVNHGSPPGWAWPRFPSALGRRHGFDFAPLHHRGRAALISERLVRDAKAKKALARCAGFTAVLDGLGTGWAVLGRVQHGSGLLSGGLGFAGGLEVGPVLLPVVWAQLLARDLPAEMLFEGVAVVWREWLQAMCPVPDVAAVWIPEDPRDFGMVVTSQSQDLFVSFDLHEREV